MTRDTLAIRLDAIDGAPSVSTARERGDAQKILSAMFRDARDIAVVSRIATDWYVFAEYLADLGEGRVRRFASSRVRAGSIRARVRSIAIERPLERRLTSCRCPAGATAPARIPST